jgi:molybdenum cofactor cytidylyltransferase
MLLREALDVGGSALVAAVGAGGKTTLLQRLATELAATGACVISTTTTAIWEPDGHVVIEEDAHALLDRVSALVGRGRVLTVARRRHFEATASGGDAPAKLRGVDVTLPARLLALNGVDYVLVEADGGRGRAIKAPAAHEPVIPPQATLVLAVAGIDALGQPLTGEIAHRPELLASLLGIQPGALLTPRHIAALLAHAHGGRKAAPQTARFVPFINKVQDEASLLGARAIAARLRGQPGVDRVVIGAALSSRPVLEVWQ